MATTATANTFLQRLLGAAALDTAIYEEVEADLGATVQAFAVVILSSIAAGVGAIGRGGRPASIVGITIIALLAWAAWALLTYVIGTQILPEPQTRADVGQLLRTIGFASTPGLIRVVGVIPGATIPAFAIAAVWMLAAMVVAVRQALDYESTGRAIGVCVLGWALSIAFALVLGLVFGRPVS